MDTTDTTTHQECVMYEEFPESNLSLLFWEGIAVYMCNGVRCLHVINSGGRKKVGKGVSGGVICRCRDIN